MKPIRQFDIIEIIPSAYHPPYEIGSKFVVVGSLDGFDVEIINHEGDFDTICIEDYKVVGNVSDERDKYFSELNVIKISNN